MESMTLNLTQRSFKVIDFGPNRKRVGLYLNVTSRQTDGRTDRQLAMAIPCYA